MKKFKILFGALSIFTVLFFSCKGATNSANKQNNKPNNNTPEQGDQTKELELVITKLLVCGEEFKNLTAKKWDTTVENKKESLTAEDFRADFTYGKETIKDVKVQVSYDGKLEVGKAKIVKLSFPGKKGKYQGWSHDIEITRKAKNEGSETQGELVLSSLTVHGRALDNAGGVNDLENLHVTVPNANDKVLVGNIQASFTLNNANKAVTLNIEGKSASESVLLKENKDVAITLVVDAVPGEYKEWRHQLKIKREAKQDEKDIDAITVITVKKDEGVNEIYGGAGQSLSRLKGGKSIIDIAKDEIQIILKIEVAEGGQSTAKVKVDSKEKTDNFAPNSDTLTFSTGKLSPGEHLIEINTAKPGYTKGNYSFKLKYTAIPSPTPQDLTFKELSVNDNKYKTLDKVKGKILMLEASETDPVKLAGLVEEDGATITFEKKNGSAWENIENNSFALAKGASESLRMVAKKDGYNTLTVEFSLNRKEEAKPIGITKIQVGTKDVPSNKIVEISGTELKVNIYIMLDKRYEGIQFKINDVAKTPDFNTTQTVAGFAENPITKDSTTKFKLHAEAEGCIAWDEEISVKHTTPPPPAPSFKHIKKVDIQYQISGVYHAGNFKRLENGDWEGVTHLNSRSNEAHTLIVIISKKDKEILNPKDVKILLRDKKTNELIIDDKCTITTPEGDLRAFIQNDEGFNQLKFKEGEHEFLLTVSFNGEVLEEVTCRVTVNP